MARHEQKIAAFVVTWFGEWPHYVRLFVESCRTNPTVDFLLFTDHPVLTPEDLPSNVIPIPMTKSEFSSRLQQVIGVPIQLKDPHKLCDFKQFFGLLYPEPLKNYDFWGYCDVDLVFGDLSRVINKETLANVDVFSAHSWQTIGHFTLLRNNKYCNELCLKVKDLEKRAQEMRTTFMDEYGMADVVRNDPSVRTLMPDSFDKELEREFVRHNVTYNHRADIAYLKTQCSITKWENGKAYYHFNGRYVEVLYIHFMGLKHAYFWKRYDKNKRYSTLYFSKIGFSPTPPNDADLAFTLASFVTTFRLKIRRYGGRALAYFIGRDTKRKFAIALNRFAARRT